MKKLVTKYNHVHANSAHFILDDINSDIKQNSVQYNPGATDMGYGGRISLSHFLVKPYEIEGFLLANRQKQLVHI